MRVTMLRGRGRVGLPVALLLAAAAALSACASAKRTFGLENKAPDEFAVVSRPPLSIPPDFNLRPPQPGAEPQQIAALRERARQAVFGLDAGSADGANGGGEISLAAGPDAPLAAPHAGVQTTTVGEAALLRLAGAATAAPGIRLIVDRESAVLAKADVTFIDRLLNFDEPKGTVVDAAAEGQRLRENQALGRPVTEGETPRIERKERGLLEGLL